jgi:hypothetical protein
VYVSKTKVADLVDALPESFWSRLSATVGLTIPPVRFDVSLRERPETRRTIRKRIEKALRRQGRLGPVDDPPPHVEGRPRYVVGDMTMRWAVHEEIRPQVVWFLGSTPGTLVALGGRARHLTHVYPEELKDTSPSDAQLQHAEKQVVAQLARMVEPGVEHDAGFSTRGSWVQDVVAVADYWRSELVDRVSFLAVVEEHCPASESGLDPPSAVLLGSPVFVFRTG